MTIFSTLGGFCIGFIRGWEMSLVCCATLPILAIAGGMIGMIT